MLEQHNTVLLEESIAALDIIPNGIYIDATFGRGGHSKAILKHLSKNATLLVIDKDPQSIIVAQKLAKKDSRVKVFFGSFKDLQKYCDKLNIVGKVNGLLFDLGVSSPQLDQAERGFSFTRTGKLDMRMNPNVGISVAEWLATAKVTDIAKILKTLGEEHFSRRIANAIIRERSKTPITTTTQLAKLISHTIPRIKKNKHPATRSFQALRIFINKELDDLTLSMQQVLKILSSQGRLVVISFHSLEDKIVKQFIAKYAKGDYFPKLLPITKYKLNPKLRKIGTIIKPSKEEINRNIRSRSAILRVAEKL